MRDRGLVTIQTMHRCYAVRFGDDEGYEPDHCDLYEASECVAPCPDGECYSRPHVSPGNGGYRRQRRKRGWGEFPSKRITQELPGMVAAIGRGGR